MLAYLQRIAYFKRFSPLSFRLLAYILIFSSIFTLMFTTLQLYLDFNKDMSLIDDRIELVENSYAGSMARSIWDLNYDQIDLQLEGLINLPNISRVELSLPPDEFIARGEKPPENMTRSAVIDLYFQDYPDRKLGELFLFASYEDSIKSIIDKLFLVLMTQFVKTLCTSIFILWFFQKLVIRHLIDLSRFAETFSLSNLGAELHLDKKRNPQQLDEIDKVAETLKVMKSRIKEAFEQHTKDADHIRRLSKAVEQSPSSVMICARDWTIEYVNEKFIKMTGYSKEEMVSAHPGALFSHTEREETSWDIISQLVEEQGHWSGELQGVRKDGANVWEQVHVSTLLNETGSITHILILGEDISVRKQYEQQLLKQANYDILTGLPNRMLAMDRLKTALLRAERVNSKVGLMFMDLDNFKHINDTLGHEAGDQLLIEASRRFNSCTRKSNTVARLGGDEFLFILPDINDDKDPGRVADRVLEQFSLPFNLCGKELFISTSIGIAVYPKDAEDTAQLLQHADLALYASKNKGKSAYTFFDSSMVEGSSNRLNIESSLHRAIEQNEFALYFQPMLACETGQLVGAEVLIRWHNEEMGDVAPDDFIPLAEEVGLISKIGEWVLHNSCIALARLQTLTDQPFVLSVNVSSRQFQDPELIDKIKTMLAETGIDPRHIELEVTERLLLDDTLETQRILKELHDLGVHLSIDDFGTGYSALSYLKNYPFDRLKIDMSFIHSIASSENNRALINAMINMAHCLQLDVVAEGVESLEQKIFLEKAGCNYYQGNLLQKPLSESEFEKWIAHSQTKNS